MPRPPPPAKGQWKKGQSGNPGGKKALPADLRKVANLTSEELRRTISKHFRMTKAEISAVLDDPASPTINLIIAKTIERSLTFGDIAKAEYLFQRLMGKVVEKIEVEHPEPVMIQRANGEQVVLDAVLADAGDDEEAEDDQHQS